MGELLEPFQSRLGVKLGLREGIKGLGEASRHIRRAGGKKCKE